MHSKHRFPNMIFGSGLRLDGSAVAIMFLLLFLLFVLLFMMFTAQPAQAQSFKVIYTFTGAADGKLPSAGLTMDAAGNFYGTTSEGGYTGANCYYGCGGVFKLSHKGSGWVLTPLYNFRGGYDGATPGSRVILGPDGSFYGTTTYGGFGACFYQQGCGTVFRLRPPASACKTALCPWTETVLYRFTGAADGACPGDLAFDRSGNLYGVTWSGGQFGNGAVFQLTPSQGGWTESVLYSFAGGDDGQNPVGLIFDKGGNLYGSTGGSFAQPGTIYQLQPSATGWTENVLYHFDGYDGAGPNAPMFAPSGSLYSTTGAGGCCQGGTAFMLSPGNGGWTFNLLYNFIGNGGSGWGFGGPSASPIMDSAGNLYGPTRYQGAYQQGNIFMLTPSGGGWTHASLHDFTGGADGAQPFGSLIIGPNGNLYGTASGGGSCPPYVCGVVFEIAP